MLPVIYRFTFDTPLSKGVLYLIALALVGYAAWSGWRNAGGVDEKGRPVEAKREERMTRAIMYGVIGLVLAGVGLYYAMPEVPFIGKGKGEGVPIHTYGVLVGSGFICAVTVAAWIAVREWPGKVGLTRRDQIFDLAFYVFVGAIIGSRDLFVIVNWKSYANDPGKVPEAYGMILDLLVLVGLIIAVVFRERVFSAAAQRQRVLEKAFTIFISVFLGGRVVFSLLFGGRGLGGLLDMLGGGLVFYGGLIGAALTALWYATANGIEFMKLADIAMPTVSLGQALGRLGCFSAGCCWGDVTTHQKAPFAVEFPGTGLVKDLFGGHGSTASLAFTSQTDTLNETRYVIESTGQVLAQAAPGAERITDWAARHGHTLPVHPTQLYESFGQTLLFIGLLALRRYRRFDGQIFGVWLICYAFLRSTVELFRGDLERGTLHGLLESRGFTTLAEKVPLAAWYNISISQFISICMFSLGTWVLIRGVRDLRAAPKVDVAALTAS